ncbi:response regulator transcription factor [Rathayibacter oskolensis]|uniref:response regulator n=1 Tax=Rathayibacter oskolensis TaxID=1891671 RepID=UPI00265EE86F|nr:response regulator transcription factor [Rathayibacter oskolensis]WKK70856.1 response regulator transcription factor [Rathayibacter oskolensis]
MSTLLRSPESAPPLPDDPVRSICVIDDHAIVRSGIAELLRGTADLRADAVASTVAEIEEDAAAFDLVILDLRLGDGSEAGENVSRLMRRGTRVLIFSAGDDPDSVRSAARAGALGMVRKSEDDSVLLDAVRSAAHGVAVASTDWAAALDADVELADADLSAREREVLALYAAGEKAQRVAYLTGLSRDTVTHYVGRIRAKYARVGRHAGTKVELYIRAIEDGLLEGPL